MFLRQFYFLSYIYYSSNSSKFSGEGLKWTQVMKVVSAVLLHTSCIYSAIWKINAFAFSLNSMILFWFWFNRGIFCSFLYSTPPPHPAVLFAQVPIQVLHFIHLFNNATPRNATITILNMAETCLIWLITFPCKTLWLLPFRAQSLHLVWDCLHKGFFLSFIFIYKQML